MRNSKTVTDTVIDDPMLDEEWLAAPTRRSRLRAVLALLLAAALCFLGGAMVQKHFGTGTTAAAGAPSFGGGQLPEGLPEGIGQGTFPEDAGDGRADDQTEAVIGEVVAIHDDVWVVKDLSGERHRVAFGDDTDVIRETGLRPSRVSVGDPVDITGTTTEGQLQATKVTLR